MGGQGRSLCKIEVLEKKAVSYTESKTFTIAGQVRSVNLKHLAAFHHYLALCLILFHNPVLQKRCLLYRVAHLGDSSSVPSCLGLCEEVFNKMG